MMRRFNYSLVSVLVLSLIQSQASFANFQNGGFEDPTYLNPLTSPALTIAGWTSKGYLFTGYKAGLVLPPKSLDDILLESTSPLPQGITDIVYDATTQSLYDYFLFGATPTTTLKLPETGTRTAMINVRTVNPTLSVSGTSSKPSGWAKYAKQATSLSQTITIGPGDIQSDGTVHIKFKIAPVMENPAHTAKQQPFYAIQINNLTTGRKGSNPLYFLWSYAAQAGVPWKTLATGGSRSGSNATYTYTDWQTYDLTFDSSLVRQNDQIELIVLAAGCSPGGHDGHIYLDDVTTDPTTQGLSIRVEGDTTTYPGGGICYTYTYSYTGSSTGPVKVTAHMPQAQNSPVPYDTIYFSNTNPSTGGSCTFSSSENVLNCNMGTLTSPATGTFQMCVKVPSDWPTSYGPINNGNFPIRSEDSSNPINPVLGNLWQTTMTTGPTPSSNSNLVVDPSGLLIDGKNPSINNGDPYTGSYTCTNKPPASTATSATCNISNLPPGFVVTGCTISPNATTWTQPSSIEAGKTVTCNVSGIADSSISREWDALITSDAPNNTNSTDNKATVPFYIYNNPSDVPASQNGSPVLTPIKICCGRPVMLYDLPIPSDLAATYKVIATTGNIRCTIGMSQGNYFVKVFGRPGTCTIQGDKDGQISAPLVLQAN